MAAKGNTYQHVISLALRWIEKNGQIPDDVGDLAEDAGMNRAKILASFPSRAAVMSGLIDHGIVLLFDAIRNAVVDADPQDPRAQLRAMAHAFFIWGGENRILLGVLADALNNSELAKDTNLARYRNSIRALVLRKLMECRDLGMLGADTDLDLLVAGVHCHILGIASMLVHDSKDRWYEPECDDLPALAIRMMDQFLDRMITAK